MSLVRAERRRLVKRRFTKLMLILVFGALATIAVGVSIGSEKIGPGHIAEAEAKADREFQRWTEQSQRFRASCDSAKTAGDTSPDFRGMECDQIRGPERADIQATWFLPYEFNFRKEFGNMIIVFGGLLALLAFIVGASIVGAEWHHGGMMNLLLWRPRRMPVLATKLGVLLGGIGAIGVALGALWTVAFWLIGRYDGTLGGMTAGVWRSMALDGARGIGLALAVGAVGFGLASIGRHTAMALGAVVGIGILSEVGTRIVLAMMRVQFPDRYSLSAYAMAWFEKELKLEDYDGCDWSVGECTPPELVITWQDSALVFGVGTAIVLAVAFWLIRRRDVT